MDGHASQPIALSPVEEESGYLNHLVHVVNAQVDRLYNAPRYFSGDSDEPQTADEVAQQAVEAMRDERLAQLSAARSEPYFGRLDFTETGAARIQMLRIGKRGLEDADGERLVVDWRAPIASMFYSFTGKGEKAAYESPDGPVNGDVALKRNVLIREGTLQRVTDSYVRGQEDNLGVTDEFLLFRLAEQKDSRLRDIVSTIQAEQDKIIRADRRKAVIIQGVAGSGKTTVALHRVAFLLYQHADRMRADRMVIFAPNAMFVDYISEVLPELGVGGIRQTTFASWALQTLDNSVTLRDPGRRLRFWFAAARSQEAGVQYEAAKFKGSEAFRDLLDLQVHRQEQEGLPADDFSPWDGLVLDKDTIRDWFVREYQHLPLAARRDRVLARIKRWYEIQYQDIKARDVGGKYKKLAASRYRSYTNKWRSLSALDLYRDACTQAAQLGFRLEAIGSKRRPEIEVEDLAGLVYLHIRLRGMDGVDRFDHVVIDEAQDFSPLQMAVLKACCPSGSFTILGDLAQSIHGYQGITDWDRFLQMFDEGLAEFFELDVSYRSTMEIIEFANGVLAPFPGFAAARPVFRSGQPITVKQVPPPQRGDAAVNAVRAWQGDADSIAVVCRTEDDAKRYHHALTTAGLPANLIRSDQERYRGGISVLPVYLTKGLEFDAVLLLDVSEENYPATAESAKLLYVGCSRALHHLALHVTGKPSPLLPS